MITNRFASLFTPKLKNAYSAQFPSPLFGSFKEFVYLCIMADKMKYYLGHSPSDETKRQSREWLVYEEEKRYQI